jgi:hypothetical protein
MAQAENINSRTNGIKSEDNFLGNALSMFLRRNQRPPINSYVNLCYGSNEQSLRNNGKTQLLEEVFSTKKCLKRVNGQYQTFHTRVEVGSNTSTVTLRVVRGDEKGSLKSETVKYGHESQVTRT